MVVAMVYSLEYFIIANLKAFRSISFDGSHLHGISIDTNIFNLCLEICQNNLRRKTCHAAKECLFGCTGAAECIFPLEKEKEPHTPYLESISGVSAKDWYIERSKLSSENENYIYNESIAKKPGSKGDPRMARAENAKLNNPNLTWWGALEIGGFEFVNLNDYMTNGKIKQRDMGFVKDVEGVTLLTR